MDGKAADQELQMLVFQKQKLAAQLDVQKRTISDLEAREEQLRQKQAAYEDTLLCVDRLWSQLNADICYLANRASGWRDTAIKTSATPGSSAAIDVKPPANAGASSSAADGISPADPFLGKLLRTDVSGAAVSSAVVTVKQEAILNAASSTEQALLARMAPTQAALAGVLDLIDKTRSQRAELLVNAASTAATDLIKAEVPRLQGEVQALQARLDSEHAASRTAEARAAQLEAEQTKLEQQVQDVTNELADKAEQLAVLQRKLAAASRPANGDVLTPSPSLKMPLSGSKRDFDAMACRDETDAAVEAEQVAKATARHLAELDAERAVSLRLQRELRDVQAALTDEGFVPHTRTYQHCQRQLQFLAAELDKQRAVAGELHRERDLWLHREQYLQHQVEQGETARRQLALAEDHARTLEQQAASAHKSADEAQLTLQKERDKFGHAKTVTELKAMVTMLQKKIKMMQAAAGRQKATAQKVEDASKEAQAALAQLETKDLEILRLTDKLGRKDEEVWLTRERAGLLKARAEDLQLFIEVLQTACDEPQDVTELRASEARLRQQVALSRRPFRHATAAASPSGSAAHGGDDGRPGSDAAEVVGGRAGEWAAEEAAWQARLDAAHAETDAVRVEASRLRREVEELQEQVRGAKDEAEAYIKAIEETEAILEGMQEQNTRLLTQLTERDDANNQLVSERIRSQQQVAGLQQQLAAVQAKLQSADAGAALLRDRLTEADKQIQVTLDDVAAAREAARNAAARAETAARELREREEALGQARIQLEAAQKAAEGHRRAADEEADKALKERAKRQRLDDENKALHAKLERYKRGENVGLARDLQEQLDGVRTLMRCGICNERQKDVIITKCYHVFCGHCIKKRLDTRNRKCPGCSQLYGKDDVKPFYLT